MASPSPSSTAAALAAANAGFDELFANQIGAARTVFAAPPHTDSPFHLLGLGVCAFLEAALGMETGLMAEATRLLTSSEAGARRAAKEAAKANGKGAAKGGRFASGLEWEILNADAVVLLGLTHALSESYMGYFQCMYALNSAHSKFTKLYKTVFPAGLDAYRTPAPSRKPSLQSISASLSAASISDVSSTNASGISTPASLAPSAPAPTPSPSRSIFGRWGSSANNSTLSVPASKASDASSVVSAERPPDGPVEELIIAGTAFGFGLFNLVFSLLPKKVQSLVGLLGFKHDRALALRALAVAAGVSEDVAGGATGRDVHGVFAGLVLMTFHGVVLLLAGYQADEAHTLRQYRAIVDSIEARYPTGALWILNRAKILRMAGDAPGAIDVLQRGLAGPQTFVQADTLLVFELAWTLLAQCRHQEAADAFVRLTELNSWSHATYYFIAAGCYVSLGNRAKAQELLDAVPELLQRKKVGGKDLPTEVLIRKKLEFYKEKQKRRGGDPARYIEAVAISPADELAIFWNTHQRIADDVAQAHIAELAALSPPVALAVPSTYLPALDNKMVDLARQRSIDAATHPVPGLAQPPIAPATMHELTQDLDTPDERALRALLLGIMHRTLRAFAPARALLEAARGAQGVRVSTWIPGVALFELAVLDLKEAEAGEGAGVEGPDGGGEKEGGGEKDRDGKGKGQVGKAGWARVLARADAKLDGALGIAGKSDIDLSSRLDSRIALLRDEIAAKRRMVGL
ncbi:outer membrane protein Iml2/Tetratricopeptide repeat protein 39 [Mycena sp. CBHHK59/15]|nr:outer membrane protein Iml2/Tetratricopeptide repeat protein 39 [Mycena sp. CBHHK59/15]